MFGRRLIVAAATAVLMAGLGACGGEGGGGGTGGEDPGAVTDVGRSDTGTVRQAAPSPDTVSGLRDSVRHLAKKTTKATRPHLVKKCTSATRRVRHTERTGTGTRRTTRTWYTTERYRTCKKVRSGTETYTRTVRSQRWCVSLDNVDGDTAKDDVWYQVARATYDEARGADEHTRMEFTPTATGC
ncbi:hypothetical protein [Streptomyces sp. NBC_01483]|uniref:hypothetical protein n=1 Tax=Streptomyces sp. NBC_01483 TaxID=2903883 RepID=UPI002E313B84|nr:hypothetical protein [Streptomyces sp. NBC_01483]